MDKNRPPLNRIAYSPARRGARTSRCPATYATMRGMEARWQGLNRTLIIPQRKLPAAARWGDPVSH